MLDSMLLADGHNDLPWELRDTSGPNPVDAVAGTDLTVWKPHLHTDFVKLAEGKLGMQFWSVYVLCEFEGHSAVTAVLEQIDVVHQLIERYPDRLALAMTCWPPARAAGSPRCSAPRAGTPSRNPLACFGVCGVSVSGT